MFEKFKEKANTQDLFGVMAPMADVVFLLLIFFMLTSAFVLEPGINIQLPRAATAEDLSRQENVLTITAERTLLLGGEKVSFDNLEKELRDLFSTDTAAVLIVRADENVPHGMVVRALDTARIAGVSDMALATEPLR